MKASDVLVEQGKPVLVYHADYSHSSGLDKFATEGPEEESFQEVIKGMADEFGIEDGQQVHPEVWVGWKFGEAEFDEDSTEMSGDVVIVSQGQIPPNHPIFRKVEKEVVSAADDEVSNASYDQQDSDDYHKDPLGYYGMKQSDFM